MHAYASDDPVFRALNQRMQRETGGALGSFCTQCHAPMAVRLGRTTDGLNLDQMPELKGVTCVFCHTVDSFTGSNDNPLVLLPQPVMGAAISNPLPSAPHATRYSELLDGTTDASPGLCGPCHDIVTPGGGNIERTFHEWSQSGFGTGEQTKTSCPSCHMPGRPGRAAVYQNSPQRTIHDHSMVGVDVALTDFPERDAQRAAIQTALDDAVDARLCVTLRADGADVEVSLLNRKVGHSWPSGSAQDRRAWAEVVGYHGADAVFGVGRVPDDAAAQSVADPSMILLQDHDFDSTGKETHLFWQAVRYESSLLPARLADAPSGASVSMAYALPLVDRVTLRVRIRPMDHDLLDELVASGDLAPELAANVTTFTLAKTDLEWTPASASPCVESAP